MAPELPADVPKTDREWLTRVESKLDSVIEKIQGPTGTGGLCKDIVNQETRIRKLENLSWKLLGMLTLIIFLVGSGRIMDILFWIRGGK